MLYEPKQISEIEELAKQMTPISDIAILLSVDENQLKRDIRNVQTDVSKAYRRGKADVLLRLRKADIELAENGSPQAGVSIRAYLKKMFEDESV